MTNPSLFYHESGKIDLIKQSLTYILCIGLALVLGYVYSVVTVFLPIIYLNALISIGFGLSLGFICRALFRLNHNRSKRSRIILAIIFGLLANYFQWTTYILWAYEGAIPGINEYLENILWIMVPDNFIYAITEINRIGPWEIAGTQIKGFGLTTIWIIEFLIIMAGPIVAVLKTTIYPYSELQQKWYPKFTLFNDFQSVSGSSLLLKDLEENPLETIIGLGLGTGLRHTKIHVFYLKEENKQYLTFEKIYVESKQDGKTKTNSSIIVNNFKISNSVAEDILAQFENNRERMDVI